jgi:glucoamylase
MAAHKQYFKGGFCVCSWWQTVADAVSTSSGLGINYVDLPIEEHQKAPVQFTFYWPQRQAWEGRDYKVKIVGAAQ